MPHRYDESEWPILYSFAIGVSRTEDVAEYLAMCDRALARCERHVVIMDARQGELMQVEHRRAVAQWVAANREALKKYRAGLGFVFDSVLVRGMLTATFWRSPPPYPHATFKDIEAARRWAHAMLSKGQG